MVSFPIENFNRVFNTNLKQIIVEYTKQVADDDFRKLI